jgi:cytochrome b subunit of formate dehydrogenase
MPQVTLASDPQNCLFCHKYRRLRVYDEEGTLKDYYVDTQLFHESIHRSVTCVGCHSDVTKVPHGETEKVDCSKMCHLDRFKTMAGVDFSHQEVAANLQKSIHGIKPDDPPQIAALKPDCKYCHLNDLYALPEEVPSDEVLARCLNCHQEEGLHNTFMHISHRFKHKTSRPPLEIVELCASCHADEDFHNVMGFNEAQAEAVETYKETIHYRILQFGGTDTAQCVDCHASESIHDIRPPTDPQSSLHADNRYDTCNAGECHPGASPNISAVDSHLSKQKDKGPEIHIAELIMEGVMFFTLFFLFTLMGMETYRRVRNRDARFFRWLRRPQSLTLDAVKPKVKSALGSVLNLHRYVTFNPKGDYKRYSIHIVINHSLMVIAFTASVVTGLPLFFHNAAFSHTVINLMGGIDATRLIHRISAIVFTLDCLYHVIVLVCGTISRLAKGTFDVRRTQVPLFKDLKDLYGDFLYFLGLKKTRPRMEKFMYKQKIHYLAMVWGCSVLTLSGCCLLFPEFMVEYLPFPKVSVNILRLMHAEESVLAFLVITLWHLYNVHIAPGRFPVQWTFWNGKINRDHQIEEHFLEYERQVREGAAACEEDKLLPRAADAPAPGKVKKSSLEAFIVFVLVLGLAASTSAYLTFKVQFVKKTPPVENTAELSYQTLRIKDQERKQVHDHFHQLTEDINLEAWAEKSACIACHSPYPHGQNLQAIAVMNLHTEFMTCHSCHLKVTEGEEIRFGWVNPTGNTSRAEPYGVRIDPVTGLFAETENHFSKLTPFKKSGGEWRPIISTADVESALTYMEAEEKYSEPEKQALVDRLHQGTELKEFIRCSRCHSKNGIMDFKELGFEPARINQLQKMEMGGMLTNYDTFYFPDIFKEKFK